MPRPLKTLFNIVSLGAGSVLSLMGAGWAYDSYIAHKESMFGDFPSLILLGAGVALFAAGYRGVQKTAAKNTPPGPSP